MFDWVGWANNNQGAVALILGTMTLVGGFLGWLIVRTLERSRRGPQFRSVDHRWVEARNYDYNRLLRELVGLDYASLSGLDEGNEGLPAHWAPIFAKSPLTWSLVINRDQMIIAYWSFFFLTKDAAGRFRSGALEEGALRASDVVPVRDGHRGPILFSMIAKHPVFGAHSGVSRLLWSSMLERLQSFDARDITITEIVTDAHSGAGEAIVHACGLETVPDAAQRRIFAGSWSDVIREELVRRSARRVRRQRKPTPSKADTSEQAVNDAEESPSPPRQA